MPVIVMICFARSGGTILNQCIGSLPNVVMLSEVNPLGVGGGKDSCRTIREQAKHWYIIDISSVDFAESIIELEKHCTTTGKHLVVRDWSYINFIPNDLNDLDPPRRLLILEHLGKRCKVIPFAFVRDAIDVWISRGMPRMGEFFEYYSDYINEILTRSIRIFKYEDFCRNPAKLIRGICEYTGLDFSESFWGYSSFEKVNGDVQVPGGSRGQRKKEIRPLPRKIIPKSVIAKLNHCEKMKECNRLLGYPVSYYDLPRESILSRIFYLSGSIKYKMWKW